MDGGPEKEAAPRKLYDCFEAVGACHTAVLFKARQSRIDRPV